MFLGMNMRLSTCISNCIYRGHYLKRNKRHICLSYLRIGQTLAISNGTKLRVILHRGEEPRQAYGDDRMKSQSSILRVVTFLRELFSFMESISLLDVCINFYILVNFLHYRFLNYSKNF